MITARLNINAPPRVWDVMRAPHCNPWGDVHSRLYHLAASLWPPERLPDVRLQGLLVNTALYLRKAGPVS